MAQTMKQIGMRNMGCVVEQMVWSNKMDLIAFSNDKAEVIIQRLNWQKIVTFPPPSEEVKVCSLSWQLDETVLAVGYSDGKVTLVDAETEGIVSSLKYDECIKKAYFSKAINVADYRNTYRNHTDLTFGFFMPQLPTVHGMGATSKSTEEHKSFAKGSPCFLVVILISGKVHLLLLGALKAGSLKLKKYVTHREDFDVHDICFSHDFNSIYALVRDGNQLKVLNFYNKVLQKSISPMLHLAVQCANILETKNYIGHTIQSMHESWETVLLEMDNKLTKYANQQPEGTISADLLELLVFGYASHEIEEFLMDDLTEKGLKKLANSVDLSFSTLQNLVAKSLHGAAINIFYFLKTTKGLARLDYFFDSLIIPSAADEALRMCGAFIMKVLELQQVIDQSMSDMKLFFAWLSVVIARLHQEDLTEEMTQLSAEDLVYLSEYLNSFEDKVITNEDGTVTRRKFNLERVGQYLENRELQQPAKASVQNMWSKLLDENECLRNCPLLFPHEHDTSLMTQGNKMLHTIDAVFSKPNESVSAGFQLKASMVCCNLPQESATDGAANDFIRSTFCANSATQIDTLVTTVGWQEVVVLEFQKHVGAVRCTRIQLQPGPTKSSSPTMLDNLNFVDLQFYNEGVISMLLRGDGYQKPQNYFVQFPLDSAKGKGSTHALSKTNTIICASLATYSIHDMIDSSSFRLIDGACTRFAVSGSRKVAAILSEQQKKMTVFEMEIDDDEDETEVSHNSLLEISKESSGSV